MMMGASGVSGGDGSGLWVTTSKLDIDLAILMAIFFPNSAVRFIERN
jgi:hypothetical protein